MEDEEKTKEELMTELHEARRCITDLEALEARHEKIEKALGRSEKELSYRNRIATVFLSIPDDDMYVEVLNVLLEAMESEYGVFGYIDEEGALVVPSMTRHIWDKCLVPDKNIVFPRDRWGHSTWPRAIREKRIIYSNEPSTNIPEGHIAISRHISLPIIHQGEAIGLIQVANKRTDYDEKDIQLLETFGGAIAPVLNARLQRDGQEKKRKHTEEELKARNEELERINRLMIGRELRMADLKKEIDELRQELAKKEH
jgi:GAF domain-containing protein